MLNSLAIKNFRMLEDFQVPKLGRVNLIVGKNNSGKSTVLEALRIYAGNANRNLLEKIAISHDEKCWLNDEEQGERDIDLPYEDLFTGRRFPEDENTRISIGESVINEHTLFIQNVYLVERIEIEIDEKRETRQRMYRDIISKSEVDTLDFPVQQALLVSKDKRTSYVRFDKRRPSYPIETPVTNPCSFIPTSFISPDELALEWGRIALTEHEKVVHDALKIVIPEFENLVFTENNPTYSSRNRRTAKVKLTNLSRPISLNSLGDGMLRVLQLALKIFPAEGGFLLIDEFENGLHYSIQEKIWALLFEMADKLDIQVFATTHSWDCIESFNKVTQNNDTIEGVLFRMGKSAKKSNQGQIIATVFDKERLCNITQAEIEIR